MDLLAALRDSGFLAPALAFTNHNEQSLINRAQRLRCEFLCKPASTQMLSRFGRRAVANYWVDNDRIAWLVDDLAERKRLTPRECEVVAAAVAGIPRDLIAADLGISSNTLKCQIRRLLLKCDAGSTRELARRILRTALAGSALRLH